MTRDEYYADLERRQEAEDMEKSVDSTSLYAGGYEAARGDYEGACLARAEYEWGEKS